MNQKLEEKINKDLAQINATLEKGNEDFIVCEGETLGGIISINNGFHLITLVSLEKEMSGVTLCFSDGVLGESNFAEFQKSATKGVFILSHEIFIEKGYNLFISLSSQ